MTTIENTTMTADDMLADDALRAELVGLYHLAVAVNAAAGGLGDRVDCMWWAAQMFKIKHGVYWTRSYLALSEALDKVLEHD